MPLPVFFGNSHHGAVLSKANDAVPPPSPASAGALSTRTDGRKGREEGQRASQPVVKTDTPLPCT